MRRSTLLASTATIATAMLLSACGEGPPSGAASAPVPPSAASLDERANWLKNQPELQDADSQALIERYRHDPAFLESVEQAYRPGTATPPARPDVESADPLAPLTLAATRLTYIKKVGWGTVASYNREYLNRTVVNSTISGLDWTRDGCSAPDGLGLGYREDFRPACYVHDFGYRNLKVYERTDTNRRITDDAFHTNMKTTCAAKAWYAEPACYAAAYSYYQGVRLGGSSSF